MKRIVVALVLLVLLVAGCTNIESILVDDGTVSAPSVSFTSDTDTGLYRIGANNVGVAVGGALDFDFAANDFTAASGSVISTNTINETTAGTGVTIDGVVLKDTTVDVNGTADALILDADGDTTLSAPTANQIDVEIGGADDFTFTANTFTVLAGSKVNPQSATNAGAVFAGYNTVAYTDTSNKTMFVIPANANLVDVTFVATTAFDDSTTDVVDCGTTSGDPDEFVDNLDVSSVSVNRMGDAADMPNAGTGEAPGDVGGSNITVLCKYTGGTADATAGAATLIIEYIID